MLIFFLKELDFQNRLNVVYMLYNAYNEVKFPENGFFDKNLRFLWKQNWTAENISVVDGHLLVTKKSAHKLYQNISFQTVC